MSISAMHVLYGGVGGQLSVVQDVVKHGERGGWKSVVVAIAPAAEFASDLERRFPDSTVVRASLASGVAGQLKVGRAIWKATRDFRPRRVFWHSVYGIEALAWYRATNEPVRIALVQHQSPSLMTWRQVLKSALGAFVADRVVYLTDEYARASRLSKVPAKSVRRNAVIPNGVDLDAYPPKSADSVTAPMVRIGTMGRLIPSKDIASLIQALSVWRRTPQGEHATLDVAGDGPEKANLTHLAAVLKLGDRVRFHGNIPQGEVPEFLRGLDVYVQPTLGETMSTAIMQAYAVGLPVVATNVPGVRSMIRDRMDGMLVEAKDADGIAHALAELAVRPRLRLCLSRAAQARARSEWSAEAMAQRYLGLFPDVHAGVNQSMRARAQEIDE